MPSMLGSCGFQLSSINVPPDWVTWAAVPSGITAASTTRASVITGLRVMVPPVDVPFASLLAGGSGPPTLAITVSPDMGRSATHVALMVPGRNCLEPHRDREDGPRRFRASP